MALGLRQIHRLYLLLQNSLPDKEEVYLVHEVIRIMESVSPDNFEDAMRIMYKDFDWKKNPGEIATMFVKGLKEAEFFSYVHFINGLRRNQT